MTKKASLSVLRNLREKKRKLLYGKANVIGTMLGEKLTDSVQTNQRSVIVIVKKKKPLARLKSEERIPRYLQVDGMRVPTDVIVISGFIPQAFSRPLSCSDRKSRAVVSALAATKSGPVAITCAHALQGIDRDLFSADPVGLWDGSTQSYVNVGHSGPTAYWSGMGVGDDYGFADVGYFTLEDPAAKSLASGLPRLPIWMGKQTGIPVSTKSARGVMRGTIHAVEIEMFERYCDVVVRVDGEGTFGGDSGMMWKTSAGHAVGIHALGSDDGPGRGSQFSACMLARRVNALLNVTLLDVP